MLPSISRLRELPGAKLWIKLKTLKGDLKNHNGEELWYSGLANFVAAAWH